MFHFTEIGGYKLEKVKLGEKKVKNMIQNIRSDIIYYIVGLIARSSLDMVLT